MSIIILECMRKWIYRSILFQIIQHCVVKVLSLLIPWCTELWALWQNTLKVLSRASCIHLWERLVDILCSNLVSCSNSVVKEKEYRFSGKCSGVLTIKQSFSFCKLLHYYCAFFQAQHKIRKGHCNHNVFTCAAVFCWLTSCKLPWKGRVLRRECIAT